MVESHLLPVTGRVARCAVLPIYALVLVLLPVAGIAVGGRAFGNSGVAGSAGYAGVFTRKGIRS